MCVRVLLKVCINFHFIREKNKGMEHDVGSLEPCGRMAGGFRREPPESTRVVDKRGTQLRLHPGAQAAITEMKTERKWEVAGTTVVRGWCSPSLSLSLTGKTSIIFPVIVGVFVCHTVINFRTSLTANVLSWVLC